MLDFVLFFIKPLVILFRHIGRVVPKDQKLWIFGAWVGQKYSDNPKYLFEYVNEHDSSSRAVWLTKSKEVYRSLNAQGFECHYFYSPHAIWLALRAKFIVYCVAYQDVSYFCFLFAYNSTIINLWHGTPLKKLDLSRIPIAVAARDALTTLIGRECDFICSASDEVTLKLQNYFNNPAEVFFVTGYPRNDGLFDARSLGEIFPELQQFEGKNIIAYMPTFREYGAGKKRVNLFESFGFDIQRMDEKLEKLNAVLLIKLHYRDREALGKLEKQNCKNVLFLNDNTIHDDIYPFLAHTNILITDYSSVYFDFLLLNRPIIFSCFDLEEYKTKDRGFYFDYDLATITPGEKTQSWLEIEDNISSILSGEDKHKQDRLKALKLFNKYMDGKNSKRAYEAILQK